MTQPLPHRAQVGTSLAVMVVLIRVDILARAQRTRDLRHNRQGQLPASGYLSLPSTVEGGQALNAGGRDLIDVVAEPAFRAAGSSPGVRTARTATATSWPNSHAAS